MHAPVGVQEASLIGDIVLPQQLRRLAHRGLPSTEQTTACPSGLQVDQLSVKLFIFGSCISENHVCQGIVGLNGRVHHPLRPVLRALY